MHIKKNDQVIVLSGKDKGKIGEVIKSFPSQNKAIVSKVNFLKKTTKKSQQNEGGIIEKEFPINVAKLMLVCTKCNKPTRIKYDLLSDAKKVRVCKKCGEIII